MEALPIDMLELPVDDAGVAPLRPRGPRMDGGVTADDPEHVKAAQGVEGEEALAAGGDGRRRAEGLGSDGHGDHERGYPRVPSGR